MAVNGRQERGRAFLNKRVCGLWLIWVAAILFAGLLAGGTQLISMPVFSLGYMAGIFGILTNKAVNRRLSYGPQTAFQSKMTLYSIILMFILMVSIGGPHFGDGNYRMVWLGAFLAIGLHFVPMAWVHGRSMILLAVLLSANALTGMLWPDLSFHTLVYVDLAVKLIWGAALLLSGRPVAAEQSASPSATAK
ncbi:DUF6609 family protein [Paenibacillus sabinae]|uniref:Uncharacterized protein n=1 Tax=Paenibacillus sabinae T27 TaxID=1268072 RepID=X4ZJP8_9BACL|nr:DUF6609 family protein [Paenibacillus sabinae]AHV99656.1 hypothetical protein PSAB_23845 [Paenibacillus sabinae T27]